MELHAGHGLDYYSVAPVARIEGMDCLNIGFSIVSRAMFVGFKNAVSEMKRLIQ
jgi:pyridoxine 5-phosphate synthase